VMLLVSWFGGRLPSLVSGDLGRFSEMPAGGLTGRYWLFSTVVTAVSLVATVIAVRRHWYGGLEFWLAVAVILFFASQLSAMVAPSPYTRFLTTTDVFRLGFAAVAVAGSGRQLATIARERERLLDLERERVAALQQTALVRGEFAAVISHELLLPLSAIRTLAYAAGRSSTRSRDRAKALALLESEVSVLSDLVSEITAASEIESARFAVDRRPVPIEGLVENLAEWTAALPGDHPVTLRMTCEQAAIVVADRERIRQVLKNLLSNAAKYSSSGSPIALGVTPTPRGVRLTVEDRGFGIASSDRARVFQKFGRGEAPEVRGQRGLGLGLYLADRIVAAHGSRLHVESVPGRGSVFSFDLWEAR
jgi:signal transduction histidine kinase